MVMLGKLSAKNTTWTLWGADMTILNELYASGGTEIIIPVLELSCDAWPESFVLCNGFQDRTIITEDDRTLTAIATGMDVALPKKDATGAQSIQFAIDNVTGEAVKAMRMALKDQAEVRLTFRQYTSNNLASPADNPVHFIVRNFQVKGSQVDITAALFDLIDMAFPRDVYDSAFAPGLKYMANA